MANLLQISSAFGRAMESVDRARMAVSPLSRSCSGWRRMTPPVVDNVIAATAEGYAFPTNLDRDQPIGGLAPQSQADLLRQAVAEAWPADRLDQPSPTATTRRQTH